MAYTVTMTTDSQTEWDALKAFFDHKAVCTTCPVDPRITGVVLDDPTKTLDLTLTNDAVEWMVPTHA